MTSLAKYAVDVELACQEIDEAPDVNTALVAKFADTTGALADKIDRYIGLMDAVKSRVALLKEQKDRISKAVKAAENFDRQLKSYVKHVMQQVPNISYKGSTGSLYLHKNPKSLKVDFALPDKTVYSVVDDTMLTLEPSLATYVKQVTVNVIDRDKLKADLEAGMRLPWARIVSDDSHVRVKG